MGNTRKRGFNSLMNEGLAQLQYAFNDIVTRIVKLRECAKSDQDGWVLTRTYNLEERTRAILAKTAIMRGSTHDYLIPHLDAIHNCLQVELHRLNTLKVYVVNHGKYEYAARLRELEKEVEELLEIIKSFTSNI